MLTPGVASMLDFHPLASGPALARPVLRAINTSEGALQQCKIVTGAEVIDDSNGSTTSVSPSTLPLPGPPN
ncbi:hypothetical protein AB4Y40_41210 [Paraburkholderia sp. EG287B]|uniref:hypothetical protein n=1 Tax=unclassified Paraburkholderia TaxID=2615204 RepID=UPI0034D1EFB5